MGFLPEEANLTATSSTCANLNSGAPEESLLPWPTTARQKPVSNEPLHVLSKPMFLSHQTTPQYV